MANKLNGFLDNLTNGVLNPKGNLGDYQHAARTFTDDYFRLAPKTKFLYHVVFNIDPNVPLNGLDRHELNILVKSADLPRFNMEANTANQYNRKKIVTTKINYDPVNIVFHDDNNNTTTDMWKAYYQYMFADGNYVGLSQDSLGTPTPSNSAFDTANAFNPTNTNKYGLDYNTSGRTKRFFTSIQISQLSRHRYFTYTLVNPVIASWTHDQVNAAEGGGLSESQMSVAYESVLYHTPGTVRDDIPTGFSTRHYDKQPSPISAAGGGTPTVFGPGGVIEGVADVFDLIGSGKTFNSPGGFLKTVITGYNTYKNFKQLNSSGIKQEGLNLLTAGASSAVSVSGLTDTSFPQTSAATQTASLNTSVSANAGPTVGNNVSAAVADISGSIKKLDDFALSSVFKKEYIQENGESDLNTIKAAYEGLTSETKQAYRDAALKVINGEIKAS
jgi:hypothetical protein